MKYSKSTKGFYNEEIHGGNIPADAIDISDDYYKELLNGQSLGKEITADGEGKPILIDVVPSKKDKESLIKNDASTAIILKYPLHTQANMTARAVELLFLGDTNNAEFKAIQAAWDDIKQIRSAANSKIENL